MGFVYEHISVAQRAELGLVVAVHHGAYGLVTELARGLGTSRQFLYRLAARVQAAAERTLAPGTPGPAPHPPAVVVDRPQLDRAIVTVGLVGHTSQRAVATCLDEVSRGGRSGGYINGGRARGSAEAQAVNAQVRFGGPASELAADELFVGEHAYLVTIEPASLLLVTVAQPQPGPHVDAAAWAQVLAALPAHGVALERLASDGGKALGTAVARLRGTEHQLDLWHVLRQIGRAERAVERTAYAALGQEAALAKKAQGLDRARPMGGYVWQRYVAAQAHAAQTVRQYDDLCTLGQWAREALDAIEPGTGRVRRRQECLAELGAVTTLLRDVRLPVADKLATTLTTAGPALLHAADHLHARLTTLVDARAASAGGGDRHRVAAGVQALGREWHAQRALATARPPQRATRRLTYERAHLLALLHWGPDYVAARAEVVAVLEGVLRGSSLVECANSWLRPYADLLKSLGPRFLPLFQLFRNAQVFARGKRAGHSPLELAGAELPHGDWLDWLGLRRTTPATQPAHSVRALPRRA